jgi:FtsH-binding integral membrane protein
MNEIIPIIFLSLGIFQNSIKKGKFTCNNFLFNVYLYIFITFLLMSFSIKKMYKHKVPSMINSSGLNFFALLFLSIGALILVMATSPSHLFGKHLAWMAWILIMSYIIYPLYLKNKSLFEIVKLQTFMVLCFFTAVTFWKPHLVKLSWGTTLMSLLLGLIVIRFAMFFSRTPLVGLNYALSYFGVVLFSIFLLYDTKILIKKAKACVRADYINDSLGVVLDGLNIFSDLFNLQNRT